MPIRRAHFIGIAGVGMSATAKLLQDAGVAVTGSDANVYPPISEFLQQQRIRYNMGYRAANVPADADVIVIGKTADLIPEKNAEVAAAYASGTRIASFPEVLGELSRGSETIVVAGSYGKSTSAALLAHCLEAASAPGEPAYDASFFIGAIPLTPATSARTGQGPLFVLEGDEYPSSNLDPRSKFLHLHPQHLLITPLAHDHLNVFPTPDRYLAPFAELAALPPPGATIVACLDGALSRAFLSRVSRPMVTYGLHAGEFHAADIAWGETTRFTIVRDRTAVAEVETTQLGEHNIQNTVAIAALVFARGLIAPDRFAAAVAGFRGVKRRLERKSAATSLPIFESFGSSYDKAKSDIAAIRRHFPDRRLVIVFEPHTFSWRNRQALAWYDDVFAQAGQVFVYEPPAHGAASHAQVTQDEIVARLRAAGVEAEPISDPDAAARAIEAALRPRDVVLLMTSGALGGLIARVERIAEAAFPAPPAALAGSPHEAKRNAG
jgi:UDP-N-acetylmuramate: L-alanyl-gamma-D-glutamyl-meso-diaminopimelate ligase